MPIVPDDKNWTWVLQRPCPECGFDAVHFDVATVPDGLRANARRWVELLAHPRVATRPSDDRWSGLEYGCHVRDVYRLYTYRLRLMLDEDAPEFPNWDQDATATEDRYGEQDPIEVGAALAAAAVELAELFATVDGAQWQRTGFRSDGAAFTVDSFARYMIHDPVHHLHDVGDGYHRLGA
jgi:hypothetical protein